MNKFLLALTLLYATAVQAVELTIITNSGYVRISPDDNWVVLGMQSKMPVATAVFQIPNEADANTEDSTNLLVSLCDQESEQGKSALKQVGKSYGPLKPEESNFQGWLLYSQKANQGTTVYTIIDAVKPIADVTVSVRLAWPHIENNSPNYDSDMKKTLERFLGSTTGALGKYEPRNSEVIRRPIQ